MSTNAISTSVSDFFLFFVRLFLFVVFGNPLSMCLFNFLFPDGVADFARNRHIFGPRIYGLYERLALKWPFRWAKWWITLENLAGCTPSQQVQYLLKVAFRNHKEVEAFKVMGEKVYWPDSYDELFFQYGLIRLPLKERDMNHRLRTPLWYNRTVAEFMMQNVRLSYHAFEKYLEWAKHDCLLHPQLERYLETGKLNDEQFGLLINAVTTDKSGGDLKMFGILLEYIRRYGISETNMQRVQVQYPNQFVELVAKESKIYEQSKVVKAFKNTDEGRAEWRKFCKETEDIVPEAQVLMSLDQYHIFHNCGRTLAPEAILAFLKRPDEELWKAVFKKEPNHGIINDEIRDFATYGGHGQWEMLLGMINESFDNLREKLKTGEVLTEKEQMLMFNQPDAEVIVSKYIGNHLLEGEAELKMLTMPYAVRILEKYLKKYKLSDNGIAQMFKVADDKLISVFIYAKKHNDLGKQDVGLFKLRHAKELFDEYRKHHQLSGKATRIAVQKGWLL